MKVDLYERMFLALTVAMLVIFIGALGASVLAVGIHVPGHVGRQNPTTLFQTAPFNEPGLKQLGPGNYQVIMQARTWAFVPNEVRVPAGSKVTFTIASHDVVHGFNIERTNANLMLVPGQVATVTVTFRQAGEYLIICHEYCGVGHHQMFGKVIVQ
jgi:cytochrome c oxidase subunit 2